mgnify:CR=1 FL=1
MDAAPFFQRKKMEKMSIRRKKMRVKNFHLFLIHVFFPKKLIFFFQNGILERSPDFAFLEKIDHVRTFLEAAYYFFF